MVLAGTLGLAMTAGAWSLATLYLYWQWFHYARQSYGISQAFRRKAAGAEIIDGWVFQAVIYLVPVWGILHRSAQHPATFLGVELNVLPVAPIVADVVGLLALASVVYWAGRTAMAASRGRLAKLHTAYMASHFSVFIIGYVLIENINYGWLVMNVWHNAQY